MTATDIKRIFDDNAHVRYGGTEAERRCAVYIAKECERLGVKARLDTFDIESANVHKATLTANGRSIPCNAYLCSGSGEVTGELYYLRSDDGYSLELCRDKIILLKNRMNYWRYQDAIAHGAKGFITFSGNCMTDDSDIDTRAIPSDMSKGNLIPGVSINVRDAMELIKSHGATVTISIEQAPYMASSQNVIAELPGEKDEWISVSAHYDSTMLSIGAYDNLSGSAALLGIMERLMTKERRYGLRFIWCGCEEHGLRGSRAYCRNNPSEIKNTVLNINLDMVGSLFGGFYAYCTAEERLVHYIEYFSMEKGFPLTAKQRVCPSDSTAFADSGVPAVTFVRDEGDTVGSIHTRYDTAAILDFEQLSADIEFIAKFTERMACAQYMPVSRKLPQSMLDELDVCMERKRKQ